MQSFYRVLGCVGAMSLLSAGACSSDRGATRPAGEAAVGSVGLQLMPVSGVTLNSVNYTVTGTPAIPGTALPSGVLPTPGTSSSFNVGFPIPVGTGYTLSLTAASAETGDDITCTGAFGPFDVTANQATNISITLTCRDNTNGQVGVGVDVSTDACPRLLPDYAVVIPSVGFVGGRVVVNALGHDLDGKTIKYAWSIPAAKSAIGSFAAANAQITDFTCSQDSGGNIPVTVTMSNGECSKKLLTNLSCRNVECGDFQVEPGESCDVGIPAGQPGGGPFGCPADCSYTCGDGVVEPPAEECELPNGVPSSECTAQCRKRVAVCGDGFITASQGEVCDPALPQTPGTICAPDCKSSGPEEVLCGDGRVGFGEECEPRATQTCSDFCLQISSPACLSCEQNGACGELSDGCLNFQGADRRNCFAVQECITQTNCGDGTNTLTSCFCGNLTTANCIAAPSSGVGSPAGICAAKIRAAMSVGGVTATNNDVLLRFIDTSVPGGAAIARYNCDKLDPACISVCGF